MRFERPPRWRRLLKDAVASAISRTRSLTSLAPAAGGCRPLVIGYHRVVEDFDRAAATDMPTMLVSRAMFERHVEWIGRHFEFVSLDEIGAHIESGEPFSRPVATITFDDGYRDVYEHAVPTLMRVGAAATVFVVTEQVDRSVLADPRSDVSPARRVLRQVAGAMARRCRAFSPMPTSRRAISSVCMRRRRIRTC